MTTPALWPPLVDVPDHWVSSPGQELLDTLLPGLRVEGEVVDVRTLGDEVVRFTARGGDGWVRLRFPSPADEHHVGLGEQFVSLDQRGRLASGVNVDLLGEGLGRGFGGRITYYNAPVLFLSGGRTVLVETDLVYEVDTGATVPDLVRWAVPADEVDVYVLSGPPRRAVELLTEMTGRPPLAPAWAYGVWKTGVSGHEAVLAQADRLREARIPCSAIWVYDHYDEDTNSGCGNSGNYPSGEYPDLPALAEGLHARDFAFLSYLNPIVCVGTRRYVEAEERGYLVRTPAGDVASFHFFHPLHQADAPSLVGEDEVGALIDFAIPEAAAWWQGILRTLIAEQDVDGWMQDFGERHHDVRVRFADGGDETTWNRYARRYHRTAAEELRRTDPEPFTFCRSGYLGTQADTTSVWPGDQICDWTRSHGIASVLPGGLSIGLTGVAAWGALIGGVVEGVDAGGSDKELWQRWCQLSALTPLMFDCLGFKPLSDPPIDLWHDDDTVATFRDAARLHVRLFPHLYGLAADASRTGLPIMRPLLLEYPDEHDAWSVDDQFLLGDALLVAPILTKGATDRSVYLPEGTWVDWFTGEGFGGGPGRTTTPAPPDRAIVLQRAGTVVPLLADVPGSLYDDRFGRGEYDLEIRVVPGSGYRRHLHDGTLLELSSDEAVVTSTLERTVRWQVWDGSWTTHPVSSERGLVAHHELDPTT